MSKRIPKPIPPDKLCPHCQRRRRAGRTKYCDVCIALLRAEGKHPKRVSFVERYREYCRWFAKGLTHEDIAEKMGLSVGYIGNFASRARKLGYEPPTRPRPERKDANPHGGGKIGRSNCKEECCLPLRREYKRNWLAANKKKQEKVYANPRMGHGEGSRGVAGCNCDLCKQRRTAYKREWDAARKARLASVAQPG